ncbi:aldo/keto reductase [Blastopirellula sp. JC732]|uniref:Aldo/keto reductase n=1 Tax=Blastopirellula sediminis TaxID=2894196 RepID=A0A9X1SHZ6_9BACT|nr:aldo/keto reductase [Blastopirellula sediminis]MCC9606361.1 aldo/keto reductase [Blastopirellula sediminis]MCC9630341.1 aldo/keto reductase [Blastopirellula sediminis]
MRLRQLGKTDLQIPPIVFGGNVFGWTLDEAGSFEILDQLQERGFTALDTANVYSRWAPGNQGGESETIIGKWMKSRGTRDQITLITKVGHDLGQGHHDLTAAHIAEAVEDSLRRLQTDRIDLYFSHYDDLRTPVEEPMEAFDKLVQAGKVRWLGASNLSAERIEASIHASAQHGWAAYHVIQPEYQLLAREQFETEYVPLCEKWKLAAITYFSLASGFLSGKYRSSDDLGQSLRGYRVEKYLDNPHTPGVLKALEEIANKHDVTMATIALAWLLAKPTVAAPIASATKIGQLDAMSAAVALTLDDADMQALDQASQPHAPTQ